LLTASRLLRIGSINRLLEQSPEYRKGGIDERRAPPLREIDPVRFAVGPNAGRKAPTLYTVPPPEDEPAPGLVASIGGFSLHAGTVCEPWQRSRLEKLCRYITRPAIATKRLSVDGQGRAA